MLKLPHNCTHLTHQDFPGGSDGKVSVYKAGDLGSSPGLRRSPGEGNDNPLQYSCLGNPMDRGACQATVLGVAKESDMTQQLNNKNNIKLDLEKAEDQRSNCQHPLDHGKAREFQKNIYFCFIDYAKAFDCVDHNELWKILQEMGIPDFLTCLLRNLYAGQEATVRTGHGTTDWFQIGKVVHQDCILSPCLFSLHAEYIMRNTAE